MSTNNTTVQFSLNGKQAQEELEKLRQRADDLKKSLEDAYRTGTKESQQYFKKELLDTQKQLRQMESGVKAV